MQISIFEEDDWLLSSADVSNRGSANGVSSRSSQVFRQVGDLPVPTPAEIRDRVRRFTPEQRAEAERDALRVELGDTAMSLAKALIEQERLDEAEQWLKVAEEYNVPEARGLLDNQWSWAAQELLEESFDEDVHVDQMEARAKQRAAEIVAEARELSDELVDSALTKVQQMLDRTRYQTVKADLASSLIDVTRVNRSEGQQTPTLLRLLFALLSSLTGMLVARTTDSGTTMSAVGWRAAPPWPTCCPQAPTSPKSANLRVCRSGCSCCPAQRVHGRLANHATRHPIAGSRR
ncbi:hypothetical protein [Amycolatopsis plumensis]|uniref:Uncharacterized protein n=1 Tax=Amycolatopsis plumensis TaxID=236508 RepID=A0ABV5U5X9_9PSEU